MYKFIVRIAISFIVYLIFSTCLIAQVNDNMNLSDDVYIELIKDINPGYPSSDLHNFINVNGILILCCI